jgi:hypothetical protein
MVSRWETPDIKERSVEVDQASMNTADSQAKTLVFCQRTPLTDSEDETTLMLDNDSQALVEHEPSDESLDQRTRLTHEVQSALTEAAALSQEKDQLQSQLDEAQSRILTLEQRHARLDGAGLGPHAASPVWAPRPQLKCRMQLLPQHAKQSPQASSYAMEIRGLHVPNKTGLALHPSMLPDIDLLQSTQKVSNQPVVVEDLLPRDMDRVVKADRAIRSISAPPQRPGGKVRDRPLWRASHSGKSRLACPIRAVTHLGGGKGCVKFMVPKLAKPPRCPETPRGVSTSSCVGTRDAATATRVIAPVVSLDELELLFTQTQDPMVRLPDFLRDQDYSRRKSAAYIHS